MWFDQLKVGKGPESQCLIPTDEDNNFYMTKMNGLMALTPENLESFFEEKV